MHQFRVAMVSCLIDFVSETRKYLSTSQKVPWAAISVWGFEDSPISWKDSEHGWYLSGDNHYNILLFSTGQYWCTSVLGAHDLVQ